MAKEANLGLFQRRRGLHTPLLTIQVEKEIAKEKSSEQNAKSSKKEVSKCIFHIFLPQCKNKHAPSV